LRGKSPLLVGMRYLEKDCSRVENGVSAIGINPSSRATVSGAIGFGSET